MYSLGFSKMVQNAKDFGMSSLCGLLETCPPIKVLPTDETVMIVLVKGINDKTPEVFLYGIPDQDKRLLHGSMDSSVIKKVFLEIVEKATHR